jgi:hypothetical protein
MKKTMAEGKKELLGSQVSVPEKHGGNRSLM